MQSKKIQLRISQDLLEAAEEAAARNWQSRSEWIRETIALRLNKQDVIDLPDPDKAWQAELERIQKMAAEEAA